MRTLTKVLIGIGVGMGGVFLLMTPEQRLRLFGPVPKEGCIGPGCERKPSPIPVPQKDVPGTALPVGSIATVKPLPNGFQGGDLVVTERFPPESYSMWAYRGSQGGGSYIFVETDVLRAQKPVSPI